VFLGSTVRRRWFGAIVLLVALGMLVCGETLLKVKLKDLTFVFYWLVCGGFTVLAVFVALLDARVLRRRTQREQRDLFEATLGNIQTEARTRSGRPAGKPNQQ
jgi:membrane protein implicated in regulation of membrane protease activity